MENLELIRKCNSLTNFVEGTKNLSNCMLLLSEDELMLNSLAKYMAMAIMCKENHPCFSCASCKKIMNNSAIELFSYPKFKKDITKEDVDDLISNIYKKPLDFDKKLIILNRIDLANLTSQNKLLKTLEELPSYAVVILTASMQNMVLPTIQSRCNIYSVPPVKKQEIINILSQEESQGLTELMAYELAMGKLFLAHELFYNSQVITIYENCKEILQNITKSNLVDYIKKIQKGTLKDYLKIFTALIGKIIDEKMGEKCDLKQISNIYSLGALINLLQVLNELNLKLKSNTNEQSLIDVLLISILEAKAQ